MHSGPFNTSCIFMENARNLLERIISVLVRLNVRYTESEAFVVVAGSWQVSVESVQGINGLHLVKFSG